VEKPQAKADKIKLDESWQRHLLSEFGEQYMRSLYQFLKSEQEHGKQIFPVSDNIFAALNSTPFERVKVVILGQDPYPTPGHALGTTGCIVTERCVDSRSRADGIASGQRLGTVYRSHYQRT